MLEADRIPLEKQIEELKNNVMSLKNKVEKEAASYTAEIDRLTSITKELNKETESLKALLEEQQAENQSLKLKYSSTIRVDKRKYKHIPHLSPMKLHNRFCCNAGANQRSASVQKIEAI